MDFKHVGKHYKPYIKINIANKSPPFCKCCSFEGKIYNLANVICAKRKSWGDLKKYFLLGVIVFNEICIICPFKCQAFYENDDWLNLCRMCFVFL